MADDFPTQITNFGFTAAAGKGLPYDVIEKLMREVIALQTVFESGRARASAYHSTTQSIPNTTQTNLNLNSEDFDVGAMHDTAVNNTRITIPTSNAGIYLVIGGTEFASSATGYRQLIVYKNSATPLASVVLDAVATTVTDMQISCVVSLAAGDYVELAVAQTSGGALNAGNASRASASFLQVVRLW